MPSKVMKVVLIIITILTLKWWK